MTSRHQKMEIAIVGAAWAVLVAIWAINGFDDTWLYATAMIIAVPTSWFTFKIKTKDQ